MILPSNPKSTAAHYPSVSLREIFESLSDILGTYLPTELTSMVIDYIFGIRPAALQNKYLYL